MNSKQKIVFFVLFLIMFWGINIPINPCIHSCYSKSNKSKDVLINSFLKEQKILASDGKYRDSFGSSVSISGDYAIIGSDNSAYLLKRMGDSWNEQLKLSENVRSVAIFGKNAIVGTDDSAYILNRIGEKWTKQKILSANVRSVSISGKNAIIGTSDAIYIFKQDQEIWTEQTKILSPDSENIFIGHSVSIFDNYAIIGLYSDNRNDSIRNLPSAYIYRQNGDIWQKQTELLNIDVNTMDFLTSSVSIYGVYAVVNVEVYNPLERSDNNLSYIFKLNGSHWIEHTKLSEARSVSIFNNYVIIGGGFFTRIYKLYEDSWVEQAKLTVDDSFGFGSSVSISDNYAIVGSPSDDENGWSSGAAYIYEIPDLFPPILTIKPLSKTVLGSMGTVSFNISNTGNSKIKMPWKAMTDASWITIENPSGVGDCHLKIRYAENIGNERDTTIEITADGALNNMQTITIKQFKSNEISNYLNEYKIFPSNKTDRFGDSVAISNSYAVIGASEAVYIYKKLRNVWSEQMTLLPSSFSDSYFFSCNSVSISGDFIIVGGSGSAFIFKRDKEKWIEQAQLLPSDDSQSLSLFGHSVSISGDFAIVGSRWDDNYNGEDAGAAYIYKREGHVWVQQTKLIASNGGYDDYLGYSVSINGNYAIVGGNDSAFIFKHDNNSWREQTQLVVHDRTYGDEFGTSVSISDNFAIVGACRDNEKGRIAGAAYIFKQEGGTWKEYVKLLASDGDLTDFFGTSVSISGNTAIVGAKGDMYSSGSVYIFKNDGKTWIEQTKIIASDSDEDDYFGNSVALSEDSAIVGSNEDETNGFRAGSAYIYNIPSFFPPALSIIQPERTVLADAGSISIYISNIGNEASQINWKATTDAPWIAIVNPDGAGKSNLFMNYSANDGAKRKAVITITANAALNSPQQIIITQLSVEYSNKNLLEQKILPSDGATDDYFSRSIDISENYAIAGSYDDDKGDGSGAAYIFKHEGDRWIEQSKLIASDGKEGDYFGDSVTMSDEYAIIGAPIGSFRPAKPGSVYIFKREKNSWIEQVRLFSPTPQNSDDFGSSVAIDNIFFIVGANGDNGNGSYSGSAYIYKLERSGWTVNSKLLPSDGDEWSYFGYSVSISGDYAIAGAWGDRENEYEYESGSAYIFKRIGDSWIEQVKLKASDAAREDRFGFSVAISGNHAIVGAYGNDDNGIESGSAYIFKKVEDVWVEQAKLVPSDNDEYDNFGRSVSISNRFAIAGAYVDDDNGNRSGSAYIFELKENNWIERAKLVSSDVAENDVFGNSVSISDHRFIIGADGDDDKGNNSGSAYIYTLPSQLIEGSISGQVSAFIYGLTNAGAGLSKAKIVIVETGEHTMTDNNGKFTFKKVPPGEYTLKVEKGMISEYTFRVNVLSGVNNITPKLEIPITIGNGDDKIGLEDIILYLKTLSSIK